MAVTVARRALGRGTDDDTITLRLTGAALDGIAHALRAVTPAMWERWAGELAWISPPMLLPDAVMITIDAGSVDDRRSVVTTLAGLLGPELLGHSVRIDAPQQSPWPFWGVLASLPAVQAWSYGAVTTPGLPGPDPFPDWLFEDAAPWLASRSPGGLGPLVRIVDQRFDVGWDDVAELLPRLAPDQTVHVYAHDPRDGVVGDLLDEFDNATPPATVVGYCVGTPAELRQHPSASVDELVATMHEQRDRLRRTAPRLTWTGVWARDRTYEQETTLRGPENNPLLPRGHALRHRGAGGFNGSSVDVAVPDAMWSQVIGPGHVEALGGVPPGAREIAEQRWEITFGDARDWIPGPGYDTDVVGRAYAVLAPLLLSFHESSDLMRARRGLPPRQP